MLGQYAKTVTRPFQRPRDILVRMQPAATCSDEELLRCFASGQPSAFELLYRRHELRVFRYLLRNLRDRALAEDALQETWFAVAREAHRYQPTGARFTTWLFTIAHHRMIDALRAVRSSRERASTAVIEEATAPLMGASGGGEPYAAALAGERLQALTRALAALPEEQRQAFLLQQEGELGVEDIAAVCGCSFETAKSRLRYARAKLRELLQDCV
ncbi:MAG TPA: sigma-70 family RNA polymerase sigma factor [Steroidobacteraceae bacterium]|nr:sigma-70 family RNA polymerase sigma factor [Steroidobacteraceae bacterium]